MNLKESFRYQRFLEMMMTESKLYLSVKPNCLDTTKIHNRSKANPDAQDEEEIVEREGTYFPAGEVIEFMEWLVIEKARLTEAIGRAKATIGFDLDAAIETNKFRQSVNQSIKSMLRFKAAKRIETGKDYKFNVEGNQTPYVYDIEVVTTEAYDRDNAKQVMRDMIKTADEWSTRIDSAMINTAVAYEPEYDVNESFEDVMTEFMEREHLN